jgi:uncharacterized protein
MNNLTKSTAMAIKAVGDAGVFEGYGSNFDVLDQGGDIVVRGAYARTLGERGVKGIKLLYQHNECEPVGVWEEMREDDIGLYCKGRLLVDDVAKAREVYALMKVGAIDGLSIGYRVVNSARDTTQGARLLQEIDLREVSIVTFPMNQQSLITSVKGDLPTEREFEKWLTQDAGFTRSQARQIITDGFKALKATPGAGDEGTAGAVDWGAFATQLGDLRASLKT